MTTPAINPATGLPYGAATTIEVDVTPPAELVARVLVEATTDSDAAPVELAELEREAAASDDRPVGDPTDLLLLEATERARKSHKEKERRKALEAEEAKRKAAAASAPVLRPTPAPQRPSSVPPPASTTAPPAALSERELAYCKQQGINPKTFAAVKRRRTSGRRGRARGRV